MNQRLESLVKEEREITKRLQVIREEKRKAAKRSSEVSKIEQMRKDRQELIELIEHYCLVRGKGPTQGEISRHFGIATSTAYNRIKALVRDGIAERDRGWGGVRLISAEHTTINQFLRNKEICKSRIAWSRQ